jgi:hypothetical protein
MIINQQKLAILDAILPIAVAGPTYNFTIAGTVHSVMKGRRPKSESRRKSEQTRGEVRRGRICRLVT